MVTRRDMMKLAGMVPALMATKDYSLFSAEKPSPTQKGPAIRKIELFSVSGNFYRFIGMNAKDKVPKGIRKTQRIAIVELADGTKGITVLGYSQVNDLVLAEIKKLIGKDPLTCYEWNGGRITGVAAAMKSYFYDTNYSWIEGGILDAIGKVMKIPVWKLFGEAVKEGIDAYDGTLYFDDVAGKGGPETIAAIGKRIKNDGYKGIKMKMGRPLNWIKGEAGVDRDIDAFIALREAVGWNFNLMADANNGYDGHFDWALRLMKACAPYQMYWMEELFPEDKSQYKRLRDALLEEGYFIPIAEGESVRKYDLLLALMKDDVYNYLQPDMRTSGMSNILRIAREAQKYGHIKLIPHNWQSQLGLIMSLHAAKISPAINFVEDDRFFNHALYLPSYEFRQGQWFIPDEPGWGVQLVPGYEQFVLPNSRVVVES